MHFRHRFAVNAPLELVADLHRHASVLKQITPPPALIKVHHAPETIREGDHLTFTLWMGPIPIFWESLFPEVGETGFLDIQGRGPFRSWRHRHTFVYLGDQTTEVVDEIEAQLRLHPWHGPVGLLMWLSLPLLFAYRQRRTCRLLEQRP
jgi:ligand-binding SRPBCC domain-containing protein